MLELPSLVNEIALTLVTEDVEPIAVKLLAYLGFPWRRHGVFSNY